VKAYQNFSETFSKELSRYIKANDQLLPKELYEPESYILSLGGKRVRPLLAMISCDLFGAAHEKAIGSAMCVELFHNFSLIHDDILDEAPVRRNQATVHKKWNTNIAILSGDMMLVRAYTALSTYPASEQQQLLSIFNKTAIQVCEGQQLDMNFEKVHQVSSSQYIEMITKKTAVLLGCSLKMGAINAGKEKQEQEAIYSFGLNLGIAFQLLDDILDLYSENCESGKQKGGDLIAGKKTILLLKALEISEEKKRKSILELYHSSLNTNEKVSAVEKIFDELKVKDHCLAEAKKFTDKALSDLEGIKADTTKKEALKNFSLQLLGRSN
jgi:geranylgeranyl diphosphate synthase type II